MFAGPIGAIVGSLAGMALGTFFRDEDFQRSLVLKNLVFLQEVFYPKYLYFLAGGVAFPNLRLSLFFDFDFYLFRTYITFSFDIF